MNDPYAAHAPSHATAIQAQGLGKMYRTTPQMAAEQGQYRTLREDLMHLVRWPFRARTPPRHQTIWALRDVSFHIQRGEIVGIIGRNGAGKSTLLKLLARITRPTTGSADIFGRVGSLLEIGTGFHAELSGRENVFLSGAVLGMRRAEIRQRFDEIIAFAEIEPFIDTPVKRYSTGMYMRLAFAVAAHLDTEILLVDEVLAVGDQAFQKKCLGKINTVAQEGRTVLFVSHNMGAIADLCERGIVLAGGEIVFDGPTDEAIIHYNYMNRAVSPVQPRQDDAMFLSNVTMWDAQDRSLMGSAGAALACDQAFSVRVQCRVYEPVPSARLNCMLLDMRGNKVFHRQLMSTELGITAFEVGTYTLRIDFPALWLAAGSYTLVAKAHFTHPATGLDRRVESPDTPVVVTGNVPRFGATLAPDARWEWQFSPGRPDEDGP